MPNGAEPDVVTNDGWADFQHINPKLAMKWAGPDHWRFTSKGKVKNNNTTRTNRLLFSGWQVGRKV